MDFDKLLEEESQRGDENEVKGEFTNYEISSVEEQKEEK